MAVVYESNCKLKLPDQIDGKEVNCEGVVFTLEGTLEGPSLLVDLCVPQICIFISHSYSHVFAPIVLKTCADANLLVQG